MRQPDFPIIDGVAIASRGAVYSVFLAYRGPLDELSAVSLDPASRTSNNLLRCLLAEFRGLHPAFETSGLPPEAGRGRLLIGDQAIRYRQVVREGIEYLDLGEEWLAQTGLPFVFAVWQSGRKSRQRQETGDALRGIKAAGLRRIREIGRLQRDFEPEFAEHYLTNHVQFDLGVAERAGLMLFRSLLQRHGLIEASAAAPRFV